jgi:hypothetical protein
VSGGRRVAPPMVTRTYRPAPNDCARALEVLLSRSVVKMAAEFAPEPDGPNDTKESKNVGAANKKYT